MFVVESRYETRRREGIIFVKWFELDEFETLEEAKEYLKLRKASTKQIDKATKLKHEYQIVEK